MDDLNNLSNEQLSLMIQMLQKTLEDRQPKKTDENARPNKFLDMAEFTMHKAVFPTTTVGVVSLGNNNLSTENTDEYGRTVYGQRLLSNPIVMTNSYTTVKVNHRDHGMYSAANNVTITGVSSEISTTISAAITTSSTSLNLSSSTFVT